MQKSTEDLLDIIRKSKKIEDYISENENELINILEQNICVYMSDMKGKTL